MCRHNNQPALTIVRVVLKNGSVQTLPYRTPAHAGCATGAGHPERRFLGWLRRMSAAQPGFPTMIRSILIRSSALPCEPCRVGLIHALRPYRLADRLRYVVLASSARPACSCGCGTGQKAPATGQMLAFGSWASSSPVGETPLGQSFEAPLSQNAKTNERAKARQQADERDMQRTPHRQADHGTPLAQAHLDPTLRNNPNKRNLRLVTTRVHREKEKMWNAYVMRMFYQHCTTPKQRRRKLTEIYTELRKKYPNDTISNAFGKEMELLEISLF